MGRLQITRNKFFSTDEVKQLIKVCEEQATLDLRKGRRAWITRHVLVAIALNSGLRLAEITALKIGDIHLGRKKTYIRVRNGEGGKKRDVYFNGTLAKLLKEYIKIKGEMWNQPSCPGDNLFSYKGGRPHTRWALYKSFKKALEMAGLPMHHSIHHARHTYAIHLLADTGDLKYVQKQLGNESSAFTAIYADILQEQNQAVIDL